MQIVPKGIFLCLKHSQNPTTNANPNLEMSGQQKMPLVTILVETFSGSKVKNPATIQTWQKRREEGVQFFFLLLNERVALNGMLVFYPALSEDGLFQIYGIETRDGRNLDLRITCNKTSGGDRWFKKQRLGSGAFFSTDP